MISAFFFFYISSSQQKDVDVLKESYNTYFALPRETVYLHLNKTIFLKGEEIWFSGYVYNRRTGLPFTETTNLYCGIYDNEGKQLTKELFYVENGSVSGHFKIPSEFGPGEYYIMAHTNWMKNFEEEDAFVQKISIISEIVAGNIPDVATPRTRDSPIFRDVAAQAIEVAGTVELGMELCGPDRFLRECAGPENGTARWRRG